MAYILDPAQENSWVFIQKAEYFCLMAELAWNLDKARSPLPPDDLASDVLSRVYERLAEMVEVHGYADGWDFRTDGWNRGLVSNADYFMSLCLPVGLAIRKAKGLD